MIATRLLQRGSVWDPFKKTLAPELWWNMGSNTLSGSDIATLIDLSGTGETLTFNSSRRLAYNATALNGQPGGTGISGRTIRGAGGSSDRFVAGTEFSCVLFFKSATDSVGGFTQLLSLKDSAASFNVFTVNTIVGYQAMNFGKSGANFVGVASYSTTSAHWLAIDYNGGTTSTAGSWRCWRNGVSQTVTTSSTAGAATANVLGEVGDGGGNSINGSGEYYEFFSYRGSGALFTAGDLTGIAERALLKFGIS